LKRLSKLLLLARNSEILQGIMTRGVRGLVFITP